jgi:hypothetical protein
MLCLTADVIQNKTRRRCVNGGSKPNDLMVKGRRGQESDEESQPGFANYLFPGKQNGETTGT